MLSVAEATTKTFSWGGSATFGRGATTRTTRTTRTRGSGGRTKRCYQWSRARRRRLRPGCLHLRAMGAGKGYALSWMSRHGYFPLEDIVHIDPDHFKRLMPEWDVYVSKGEPAGDRCHRESGFIQEIAQEAAMRKSQNVWVDGSLRDGDWFKVVFQGVRKQYPHYKIAIFEVTASEANVRARIAKRERLTGRGVPSTSSSPPAQRVGLDP